EDTRVGGPSGNQLRDCLTTKLNPTLLYKRLGRGIEDRLLRVDQSVGATLERIDDCRRRTVAHLLPGGLPDSLVLSGREFQGLLLRLYRTRYRVLERSGRRLGDLGISLGTYLVNLGYCLGLLHYHVNGALLSFDGGLDGL